MPRNIEYLVGESLKQKELNDTDFIKLLLTASTGINAPHEIMKKVGLSYGIDAFLEFETKVNLKKRIKYSEKSIVKWREKLTNIDSSIETKLERKFNNDTAIYNEQLAEKNLKLKELLCIIKRIESFSVTSNLQKEYKGRLLLYFKNYKKIVNNEYKYLKPPVKKNYEDYIQEQITWLENLIDRAENYLNYDESFFNEIINQWFPKKND